MQTLYFECKDKHLIFKKHSKQYFELISDNDDYIINIDIQEERKNAMFLRIVFPDKTWRELAIDTDGNVEIPLWALQFRLIDIGVTSGDSYATLPTKVAVKGSIKAICGEDQIEIPEQSTIDQLIALVNSIDEKAASLPAVSDADNGKIAKVVNGAWTAATDSGGGIDFTTDETLKFDDQNRLGVNTTSTVTEDNTLPITAAGVYTLTGNITALLETI